MRCLKLTKFNPKKLYRIKRLYKKRYSKEYMNRISGSEMKKIINKFKWRYLL